MKWKLKRDLPWHKSGTEWEKFYKDVDGEYRMNPVGMRNATYSFPPATFSDWFEEVDERWKPRTGEEFFFAAEEGGTNCLKWENYSIDEDLYKIGNCFKTKTEAEQAAEQIKALLKEFHKNNP